MADDRFAAVRASRINTSACRNDGRSSLTLMTPPRIAMTRVIRKRRRLVAALKIKTSNAMLRCVAMWQG